MDRGQREGDVPHVGRVRAPLGCRAHLDERAAERFGVAPIAGGDRGVVMHLGIWRMARLDGEDGAGGERARLEAAPYLATQVTELVKGAGADRVERLDVGRH